MYRAKHNPSSKIVALKQVRVSAEERQNGIPITTLREISILRSLKHSNIINVIDVAVGQQLMDEAYMVMEYAEQVGIPRWSCGFCKDMSAPGWLIFRRRNRALEVPVSKRTRILQA